MLPRFSDPCDIREFVQKLEDFERGTITSEEFRAFRLTRGVYGQRQDGEQMLRVKIPMGLVGNRQLHALADVGDRHSRGFGHVTTRQNVQFHFMKMGDAEAAMHRLDEAGLTTREACGNSVRTVTACDLAEVCETAPFDVTPHAEALTRLFLRHPLSASLPRKFKTAFSGCPHDCAKAAIHDLGFVAKVEGDVPGFRVLAAGGLSSSPQAAIELEPFVPAALIGRVGEAIVRLFHALGNRENRQRARLKYVLRKLGEQGLRDRYRVFRDEVDREAAGQLVFSDRPARPPAAPVITDERPPGYLAWRASAVIDQKQQGYRAVHLRLRLGDVTSTQLRGLADVVDRFGDGSARFTIDQNVLLPWVDVRSLPALFMALTELDLARLHVHTARDVTSCPGADTCNLAVTTSRRVAAAIAERLAEPDVCDLPALASTTVKVSGCPNSCGHHHVADIGFHGGAKTFHGASERTVPVYQLHLGGSVDERGAHFGRQVVKIVARRVPEAVVRLLRLYSDEHASGESPKDFFARVDPKRVTAALGDVVTTAPTREDELDIGETTSFVVDTRDGECAA
jgi:sulfite reductase (NADPH) hemoprotein beta-component